MKSVSEMKPIQLVGAITLAIVLSFVLVVGTINWRENRRQAKVECVRVTLQEATQTGNMTYQQIMDHCGLKSGA